MARRVVRGGSSERRPTLAVEGLASPPPPGGGEVGVPRFNPPGGTADPGVPQYTGRRIVVFRRGASAAAAAMMRQASGVRTVASTADAAAGALSPGETADADMVVFDRLDVAVVAADMDVRVVATAAAGNDAPIEAVIDERYVYATSFNPYQQMAAVSGGGGGERPRGVEYLRGLRDGLDLALEHVGAGGGGGGVAGPFGWASGEVDESQATWGLQATRAHQSTYTGRGVSVAVLDTGIDLTHPDFPASRLPNVQQQSFVSGVASVQDGNGHGTHCCGTACGPLRPGSGPRYGVAPEATLFVGKVMFDAGYGLDAFFIAGLTWAITNGCRIASMSLGGAAAERFDEDFELIAARALDANLLIVAAAGNRSDRRAGSYKPVDHPADCPSILAVGGIDVRRGMYNRSNRGLVENGGQVDLVGPGVDVYSSVPLPTRYGPLSGTSMATPHVAGIAALYAEKFPTYSARELRAVLAQQALRMAHPSIDIGAGLVQAP